MATKRQYPELWDEFIELTKNDETIEHNISRIQSLATVFFPKKYQYVRTKKNLRGKLFIAENKNTKERILFTSRERAARAFGVSDYVVKKWTHKQHVQLHTIGFFNLYQHRYIPLDKTNFNLSEWNGKINEL